MLERILLAVDGSDASRSAARTLVPLARDAETDVLVVHVTHAGGLRRTTFGPDSMTIEWTSPPQARALVDRAVDELRAAGVRARGQVYGQFDTLPRELLEAAHSFRAGLVALGSRGMGRLRSLVLGSVARRLVHLADLPVLVSRGGDHDAASRRLAALERIVLGVDGSATAQRAASAAAEVARRTGATVTVLHACGSADWTRYRPDGISVEHDGPEAGAALVDEAVLALLAQGITADPEVLAGDGSVAERIVDAAAVRQADLIVVGARGRSVVPGLFLGSTVDHVLHADTCPVLVAR